MSLIPVTLRDLFWSDPFFESAWGDDFGLLRRDMMREHRMMWDRFAHELDDTPNRCGTCSKREAEQPQKEGDKKEGEQQRQVAERPYDTFWPWFMPPRRWMGPSLGFGSELAAHVGEGSQLMRVKEDETKFEVSLDTHEYRPDELKVNVSDNMLSIEGKHEEKSEDGNSMVTRQFIRKYSLPKGCQAQTINSNLSSDGVLMITAPKVPYQRDHSIPIQMQQEQAPQK